MKIDNLEYWVQRTIPQVYEDSLSFQELLAKVLAKLNEVIDQTNEYFGQNIESIVESIMNDWRADGTLDSIFNGRGINVRSYSNLAVGSDWTNAFKQVLTDMKANGDKVLIVPDGTYQTDSLELFDGLTIEGIGNVTIQAKALTSFFVRETMDATSTDIYPLLYANDATGIKIKNITLDANRAIQTKTNVSAILFTDCSNLEFDRVTVKGNKSPGSVNSGAFNLFRCTYSKLLECNIDDVQVEGVLLRSCQYIDVIGGEFKNSTSTALGTQYGSHILFDRVHAHDCYNSCISLNSTDSKIVNSLAHDSTAFVPINLGHRTTYDTRKPASRSIVTGNRVYNGYKGGIFVGYGFDIEIHDNIVSDCRGAYDASDTANVNGGISPSGWCDRISVKGNKIWNCGRGVHAVAGRTDANETLGSRFSITDNEIFDNHWQGIDLYDPTYGVIIDNNFLYRNNTENNSTRAEIRVTCSKDLGQVRIVNNLLGEPGVAKGDAIRITWVTDALGYTVNIQGNEFSGYSRTVMASNNNVARLIYKNNIVNNAFVA